MEKYKLSIELSDLLYRDLRGELTTEEQARMRYLLSLLPENTLLPEEIKNPERLKNKTDEYHLFDTDKNWRVVYSSLKKKKRRVRWYGYAAAVMLLLTLLAGGWYLSGRWTETRQSVYFVDAFFEPNKTILELPDGEKITLDSTSDITNFLNHYGILDDDKNLDYSRQKKEVAGYHRIEVPRGGEYSLKLEDGTRVWLFAESEIRFPAKFDASKREIFLSGEAFLEVSHDPKRPFTVKTNALDVQVLGTVFNVKAYDDSDWVEASLIEGVICVNGALVAPDTQAVFNRTSGELSFRKINGSNYLLRKERMFVFEEERLDDILQEMARWYDFSVFYQNAGMADKRFGLKLEKYENVDSLFKLLELTGEVKFELNDNVLVVKER